MEFLEQHGVRRVINALGTSTIVGANIVPPEVCAVAAEMLRLNVEIDDLQRAASRAIAKATHAEAGCVTSSASSALAITAAAAMTGADLARIVNLPDTGDAPNEVILQHAHDINFGARISQMVRLSGARVVTIGTANHCDEFHLRGAIRKSTAAVLYVVNGAVTGSDLLGLEAVVRIGAAHSVPVIVDAAAEPNVRPFVSAGASLVITSGHKAMGAPTSGLICGRKELVRACYLQNWGIGRAMKVGKEGIAGLIAALERWYGGGAARDFSGVVAALREGLTVRTLAAAHRVAIDIESNALRIANLLREGDPPVWVHEAAGKSLILDLRPLSVEDAQTIVRRVKECTASPAAPRENVPYHDLYWSERRLLAWPD